MFTSTAQLRGAQVPGKMTAREVKGKTCWLVDLLTSARGLQPPCAHVGSHGHQGAPNDNAL